MRTKEDVIQLAYAVQGGNQLAFCELEGVAKPLLVSLANRFSNYHYKFEFDDFYSIGMLALYEACMKFQEGNPSFLDFAKLFIIRAFWREIEHWNQDKRNIFKFTEIEYDSMNDSIYQSDLSQIVFVNDFRDKLNLIIDECFDEKKSEILKMYFFNRERVCDIAQTTQLNYSYVHKVVERGTKKIKKEYSSRYNLDNSTSL
jgi:RNA polymerase sigma factor (sigma-70 family)